MTDPKATAMVLNKADFIREHIKEIDARVTPSIGPTFGSDGEGGVRETREGRIQSDDFQALVGYAMGAVDLTTDLTTSRQETDQARVRTAELENDLYSAKYSLDFYERIRTQALSASLTCEDVAKAYWDAEDSTYMYDVDSLWARTRLTECLKRARIDGALLMSDRLRVLESNQRTAGATEVCEESLGRNWDGHIHNNCRGALGLGGGKGCDYENCPIRRAAMAGEKG